MRTSFLSVVIIACFSSMVFAQSNQASTSSQNPQDPKVDSQNKIVDPIFTREQIEKLPNAGAHKPCLVHKVYVAELGSTDEAARFRRSLVERLSKRFAVAETQEEADAVLTAAVSARGNGRNGEVVFENGMLKSKEGDVLWQGNFYYHYKKSFPGRGIISSSASDVAKHIRQACQR
jgi:hypothetical protein